MARCFCFYFCFFLVSFRWFSFLRTRPRRLTGTETGTGSGTELRFFLSNSFFLGHFLFEDATSSTTTTTTTTSTSSPRECDVAKFPNGRRWIFPEATTKKRATIFDSKEIFSFFDDSLKGWVVFLKLFFFICEFFFLGGHLEGSRKRIDGRFFFNFFFFGFFFSSWRRSMGRLVCVCVCVYQRSKKFYWLIKRRGWGGGGGSVRSSLIGGLNEDTHRHTGGHCVCVCVLHLWFTASDFIDVDDADDDADDAIGALRSCCCCCCCCWPTFESSNWKKSNRLMGGAVVSSI